MPTLDIYITPMENKTDDEEWLVLQRELESRLELNSVVFSRYRVFLS
jgi:hypothetical protein